jgi:type I restriction enzyme R subunit
MKPTELAFGDAIESSLITDGGYLKSSPANFDPVLGLDPVELFAFIETTQPTEWSNLVALYGNDPAEAQSGFAKRLAAELNNRGTVDVLRHGIVDRGPTFHLAYFKPAHGLTDTLTALYAANRVTVTRQLAYESGTHKTRDLALLVNGIPTATAELKNPLTNQTVEHAIEQYRKDRDPTNTTLSRRALVHFAVDPERIAMTTKLTGTSTRFLPFNLGHEGGRATHLIPSATALPTSGKGSGHVTPGWTSWRGSSTSNAPPRGRLPPRRPPKRSSFPGITSGMRS